MDVISVNDNCTCKCLTCEDSVDDALKFGRSVSQTTKVLLGKAGTLVCVEDVPQSCIR